MRKVGIVTYYNIYNYGSVLQAYALQKAVESIGYRAVIIDYANMRMKHNIIMRSLTYINRLFYSLRSPAVFCETLAKKKVSYKTVKSRSSVSREKFKSFIVNKLALSTENYLRADKNGFAAFVTGSDQVWQLNAAGLHELFFLRFAPEQKRIAYAPSFGGFTIPEFNKKRLKKYLSEIPYISVRDDSGVDVVFRSIKQRVPQVLDPVILIGKDFWEEETKNIPIDNNRLLICYFNSDASGAYHTIDALCEKYNLEVVWLSSGYPLKGRSYCQYDCDPLEFPAIIKNARFVCTDSLHGLEFSILFNVPFFVFDRQYEVVPEQRTRIDSLLRLACLEERLVKSAQAVDIQTALDIDFNEANNNLKKSRVSSLKFLKESLAKQHCSY
jgi:hypothetical protein